MPQQALQIDFSPVTDALRDLVHRLERSERRSETALSGLDETLADLSTRIEHTEKLSREPGSGLDGTLAELRERLEKSERGLERAEHLNTDAMRTVERGLRAISNRLEETDRRSEEVAKRLASGADQSPESVGRFQAALGELARRLESAESSAHSAREQATQAVAALNSRGGANDDSVKALERAIGNVVDHIEASDARTAKALSQLREDMESAERKSDKPSVGVEAIQALETTISALQRNITDMGGRLGQVETSAKRDVDQIAGAIEDMGNRLDKVRDAAVSAAVEAAGNQGGAATQLVAQLAQKVDENAKRLEQSEQQSAKAIHTIETSVGDIAGQMREIANLGSNNKAMFAEPMAALETAIEEMASRLQTTDQRSARALAKVEEVSDELLRKIEDTGTSNDIQKIKATVENVDARLNLIESQNNDAGNPVGAELGFLGGAPAAQPTGSNAEDSPFGPPPMAAGSPDGQPAPPFGPATDASQMGAPPFADGPSAFAPPFPDVPGNDGMHELDTPPRNDFLESARRAARAASGSPSNDGARSPFADETAAYPDAGQSRSRKPLALIAAGLATLAVAGLVFVFLGGGPREVAGPPAGVEAPADVMAELDASDNGASATSGADDGMMTDDAISADAITDDAIADEDLAAAEDDVTRAPARDLPDVVSPARASTEAANPGAAINGPTAITPRREVEIASLPNAAASPATLPRSTPAAPAVPTRQARPTLREAATEGDSAAQYEIGQRYAEGANGLPQDDEQAAFWLNRAAEQGLAPAQYRLGTMFEKGTGVPENPTKARTWYERASEQGNIKAMHNLAVMQAEGAGGPQDFAAAARSFEAAAQYGLADSQYNLAILYERGLGVERDLAAAYKWFSIAAANGDKDAGARAEALKNSVDAAKLVDSELAARTFNSRSADPAANQVSWQADAPPPALVREAQRLLSALGYDAGPSDGMPGSQTIDAVRTFERDKGLAVTGRIDERLLDALQRAAI